jgi:hypothetical protein
METTDQNQRDAAVAALARAWTPVARHPLPSEDDLAEVI